jgi:hypothetical protein
MDAKGIQQSMDVKGIQQCNSISTEKNTEFTII